MPGSLIKNYIFYFFYILNSNKIIKIYNTILINIFLSEQYSSHMENIIFNNVETFQQTYGTILYISYEQASNTLVLINHQNKLIVLEYNPKEDSLRVKQKTEALQQLSASKVLLLQYLVDNDKVVCITEAGCIFTVDSDSIIDIKAENQDGITAASLSPTQQYIYVVTKNSTLIQLDMEFDLVNQIPLDENEEAFPNDPRFSWRPDGNFFVLNIETKTGRKCVTRDKMMNPFISPSKSDTDPKGLVQSVAQKGRKNMGSPVAWQPNGGIIAGTDEVQGRQRIIFWQKNGLRHLQFDLLPIVKKVNDLFWSPDSTLLYVDCQVQDRRVLYFYYRSNYKWHLKNQVYLTNQEKIIRFKTKHNKVLLAEEDGLRLIDWTIQISRNEWLNKQEQKNNPYALVYCIDGAAAKVSDYAKALIPPPFSLYTVDAGDIIIGSAINKNQILLITQKNYKIYNYQQNKVIKSWENTQKSLFYGILLLSEQNQPLEFIANNHYYRQVNNIIVRQEKCQQNKITQRTYKTNVSINSEEKQQVQINCIKTDSTLVINNQTLTEDCLSFMLYHEFLLYTVSTNDMYDKLFVFNLKLDRWVWDDQRQGSIHEKIQEISQKQQLNVRNVERGSKIITCTKGRVVFQLPRGNLQGIYPKVIMINEVKNKMEDRQFGQAFEIIRTHRLDFNLLIDIDQKRFIENAREILEKIQRVDYLNLLISQISEKVSSEVVYCLSQDQIEEVTQYHEIHLKGKKVKKLCQIISKQLRSLNQQKFILSIFTSDLRRGLLNEVLFEIKQLKKNDVQVVVPPHIVKAKNDTIAEKEKSSKKLNSQQILQYVCWLVDANFIYEAALLTYDLQLAAMTARCTQKDPKEYIPYIESLKEIQNEVEFRKKICLDLKKHDVAIKQLSLGSEQQQEEAIQLVKTHKLFRCGLQTFAKNPEKLKLVKQIIIDELLSSNEISQAYQLSKSIKDYERCMKIATSSMDTKKIKECLENMNISREQKVKIAKQILQKIKEEVRNKSDLARLYVYIESYEEAVSLYLKNGDYRKFYQYLNRVSAEFIEKEVIPGLRLQCSLRKNLLLKDKNLYHEKYVRLLKVHKHKKSQGGQTHTFRNKQNEDMYSEVSVSSKASSYTMSTTTGMRKKKEKKRDILTRNVKQGSILEEQYLLAFLSELKSRAEENIKTTKLLVQHLIYLNLIEEADDMKAVVSEYIEVMNEPNAKSYAKIKFEQLHPEAVQLYYEQKKNNYTFDSFNYLLK